MKALIRTMPLITSEITIINNQEVTTALTLRYTLTPLTRSLFDTYRFVAIISSTYKNNGLSICRLYVCLIESDRPVV